VLWLDTQFGEEGQGASLPSLTPRLAGRTPEQPAINTPTARLRREKVIMVLFIGKSSRKNEKYRQF
jgi:hypothetical protein